MRLIKLGILPLIFVTLIGCNSGIAIPVLGIRPVSQISDLQKHGRDNHQVYVQGTVIKKVPFLGSGAYQIQDNTGTIWVITNRELPQAGDKLFIEGNLRYQSIPIGEQELGEVYVLELNQLEPSTQADNTPVPTTTESPNLTGSSSPLTIVPTTTKPTHPTENNSAIVPTTTKPTHPTENNSAIVPTTIKPTHPTENNPAIVPTATKPPSSTGNNLPLTVQEQPSQLGQTLPPQPKKPRETPVVKPKKPVDDLFFPHKSHE